MVSKINGFFLVFFLFFTFSFLKADPLLVVALMVKNEEAVIQKTLEPYLIADSSGKLISYLIFDTGSTDNTIVKVRELFQMYGAVHYKIFQEEFVDFSTSRNRALDLVKQEYPSATFVLMPDAEWYINDVSGLIQYCIKERNNEHLGPYLIRIIDTTLDFFVPRLLRQKLHGRFKGVVHEALIVYSEQIPFTRVPASIYFEYKPLDVSVERSKLRHIRDREILLKAFEKDPYDMMTTFYLGQTYESLGDWHNAFKFYSLRAEQKGWEEDDYLACYKRAYCADQLAKQSNNISWDFAHALYLAAYATRPTRIEPLIRIALHYFEESNMPLAYLYAKYALDIPYPENDTNFVEKELYHYSRYALVGMSAWQMQQFDIGEQALRRAIEAQPDNLYLYQQLKLYVDRRLKH